MSTQTYSQLVQGTKDSMGRELVPTPYQMGYRNTAATLAHLPMPYAVADVADGLEALSRYIRGSLDARANLA